MNDSIYELILEAKNGNKKALENLLKQEQNTIKATLYYLKKDDVDIKDLTQEILFKVSKKLHQLKNPKCYKTWLNQIILNSYYDYLRKNKKYKSEVVFDKKLQDIALEIPDYATNPQDSVLNNELDFVIKTTISNLPIHYKIPITLREIQGLSYDEISNITKATVGTIKSRIARARVIIKQNVSKYSRGEI